MLASKIEKEKNCARENQRTDFKCDRDSGPDKKINKNKSNNLSENIFLLLQFFCTTFAAINFDSF